MFTRDLNLPRGPERERVWARDSDVLCAARSSRARHGRRFRVVPADDLRDGQDRRSTRIAATCGTFENRGWSRQFPRSARIAPWSSSPSADGTSWNATAGPTCSANVACDWRVWSRTSTTDATLTMSATDPKSPSARQEFYAGVRSTRHTPFAVHRPRELIHDAQVYRAYLKEADACARTMHSSIECMLDTS